MGHGGVRGQPALLDVDRRRKLHRRRDDAARRRQEDGRPAALARLRGRRQRRRAHEEGRVARCEGVRAADGHPEGRPLQRHRRPAGRRDRALQGLGPRVAAAGAADERPLLVARATRWRVGGRVSLLLAALRLAEDRRDGHGTGERHLPDVRQGRPHPRRDDDEAQGLPRAAALALLRQREGPRRRDRAGEEG